MPCIVQTQRFCPRCGGQSLFTRPGTNHLAHAIISLFLCGMWIPLWILITLLNDFSASRCIQCGTAASAGGRRALIAGAVVLLFIWAYATYDGATYYAAWRARPDPIIETLAPAPSSAKSAKSDPSHPSPTPLQESASTQKKLAADQATFKFHKERALAGNVTSMDRLAELYATGTGCDQDTNAASKWRAAAASAR